MTYEEIQDRIDEENDERREEAQKTFNPSGEIPIPGAHRLGAVAWRYLPSARF